MKFPLTAEQERSLRAGEGFDWPANGELQESISEFLRARGMQPFMDPRLPEAWMIYDMRRTHSGDEARAALLALRDEMLQDKIDIAVNCVLWDHTGQSEAIAKDLGI